MKCLKMFVLLAAASLPFMSSAHAEKYISDESLNAAFEELANFDSRAVSAPTHEAQCKCDCGETQGITFRPAGGILCDRMNGQECTAGDPPVTSTLENCKWIIVPVPALTPVPAPAPTTPSKGGISTY